ncbi:GNAT family N-acetyltransferase [Sagittula sp. NFXS13]|uniref:GNAT family N-acetyltransferase n=1 Tax=Sagittula sp. NFXS13 TaxID=2819095 RepID=UPI0032DF5905
MTKPVLHTERLTLRLPLQADWPAVRAFMCSERSAYVGGPMEDENAAWRAFLASAGHWTMKGFGYFTVLHDDAPVGRVGIVEHPAWDEPELGWQLFDGFEGQGYVTEAATAVRDWAYGTLRMGPLISYIHPDNIASQRVAQRLGAQIERETTLLGGPAQVWRHPSDDDDGNPEAYA